MLTLFLPKLTAVAFHAGASIFHSPPCFENVYASVPVRV